jgi:N-hydroxyarylamine O-acetyltransferase
VGENAKPCIDVSAYLARIGHPPVGEPGTDALRSLHLAHVGSIPFENLDILLGRPIRLDLPALQAKLINARRGGYCFEQNLLFADVLEQLGFAVTRLAARVRLGTTRLLPRTHMVLRVEAEGQLYLADVGFGGAGLLEPIPFTADRLAPQHGWTYRLVAEGGPWVLQSLQGGAWVDLYAFSLEEQNPVDYEVANHYVSTHPDSRFVQTLTAQRSTPGARLVLRNRDFCVESGTATQTRRIADEDDLLAVLAERFGLNFPPGTRFRPPFGSIGWD